MNGRCGITSEPGMHEWMSESKVAAKQWMSESKVAADEALQFYRENQTPRAIEEAGEKLFKDLYKCPQNKFFSSMGYHLYSKSLSASKSGFKPESLPPTQSAAAFHARRVYFQVMEWKSLKTNLDPINWGWKLQVDKLTPIMTDQSLAPTELLLIVRCSCRTSTCS